MRTAFIRTLIELSATDDRIFLVVGDLGFGVVEEFAKRYADRFLNVGVAEQNLAGVGAGLALSGATVFAYSIANFPTLRCMEQIRNDICYNGANVKIVAVGAGLAYGALGATHHATEDLAMMRALPNMTVVSPADPIETRLATRALALNDGPAYLRIGRAGDATLHSSEPEFRIGRALRLRDGKDVSILATGAIARRALQVAERMAGQRSVGVISMATVKPIDRDAICDAVKQTPVVVSLEEHSITGGLGSAIAEVLADEGLCPAAFARLGLPDSFAHVVGSQDYLLDQAGLSVHQLTRRIEELLEQAERR